MTLQRAQLVGQGLLAVLFALCLVIVWHASEHSAGMMTVAVLICLVAWRWVRAEHARQRRRLNACFEIIARDIGRLPMTLIERPEVSNGQPTARANADPPEGDEIGRLDR